jgi:hypothetical protein
VEGSLPVSSLLDDAFRAALDGEVLNLGDEAWRIGVDGVWPVHGRFWLQLRAAHGTSVWTFTLVMPPFADRLWLFAAVGKFLRHPEHEHQEVMDAIRTDASQFGE